MIETERRYFKEFRQIEKKEHQMSKIKVYEVSTLTKYFKIWTF